MQDLSFHMHIVYVFPSTLIYRTDSSVISALNSAQLDMIGILSAGQNLAIDCTATAGGVAPGKRRRGLGAFIWGY